MTAVVLVPGLLDVDASVLAACDPLSRIAARARPERVDDAEGALLHALDCACAAAPLAALGAGVDAGGDWIARADPVTTIVSHDDVRIVARVDDLDDDEVRALRALLDRHFADDGLAFVAARHDAWFVRSAQSQALLATPLTAAIDRPLRTLLPAGDDARRWRRWWTEVQMLLHEQPIALPHRGRVGIRIPRVSGYQPDPVNALWFSGPGTLPRGPLPALHAYATPTRDGDVLRGLASLAASPCAWPRTFDAASLPGSPGALLTIIADRVDDATTLDRFATTLLVPLLAALDRRRIDRLVLIADGRADAARWTLTHAGLLGRLLPRRATFAAPAREGA